MYQRYRATLRKARTSRGKRKPKENNRHIPAEVRREVLARDGVRCTFVSSEGHRCTERGMLEFHHEEAYARGGLATTSNIRMLCRKHNQLLAEHDYGRRYIQERVERGFARAGFTPARPGTCRAQSFESGATTRPGHPGTSASIVIRRRSTRHAS
jgi:hypothetical protein